MNFGRNGVFPSSTSFKSNQSFENYQPHYFGVRSNNEPKKLSSFPSLGLVEHNGISDQKLLPTATSLRNIPEPSNMEANKVATFKKLMLVCAASKWTEKEVNAHWGEVEDIIQKGWNGSQKQLRNFFDRHKTPDRKKRSRSEELIKHITATAKKEHIDHRHSPKLQRFHSLNYQNPTPQRQPTVEHKAKSADGRAKKHQADHIQNQAKQEGLLRLCTDIEQILCEGERRLAM